jgi:hypothetical protein
MFDIKGVDQLAELGLGVPRFGQSRPAGRDTIGRKIPNADY